MDERALTAAFSVWAAVTVALVLQFEDPWWAAVTALRVSVRDYDAEISLLRNRLFGTVAGAILGLAIAPLIFDNHALAMTVSFAAIAFGTYMRFTSAHAYAWILGSVTCLLVLNGGFFEPDQVVDIAFYRSVEVLTGVLVVYVVDRCLLPREALGAQPKAPVIDDVKRAQIVKSALTTGTMAVILPTIWLMFELPSPFQVILTVVVVLNLNLAATTTRGTQRLLGVLIGGIAGLIVAAFSITSFVVWSIVLFAGIALASGYHNSDRSNSYIGLQAGFGFVMALVTGSGPADSILPAIDRIVGIGFGMTIALVVYLCIDALLPDRIVQRKGADDKQSGRH
ncbi:MAG: FUSC family protein [Pseudomonadota bacterium]